MRARLYYKGSLRFSRILRVLSGCIRGSVSLSEVGVSENQGYLKGIPLRVP